MSPDVFLSAPLARALTEIVQSTGRRIGLLVDRQGGIDKVVVGDATRVFLPNLGARRAGAARFRGVRLILAGSRPDGLTEDDLTDLMLLQLDAVISIHADSQGLPGPIEYGHLLPPDTGEKWRVEKVPSVHQWTDDWSSFVTDLESQFARSPQLK
jgi:GTP-binding protein HflX